MYKLQGLKTKPKNAQYDRANIERAFNATQNGMSVYRASRDYGVPESTLRDRTRGNVTMDSTIGFESMFSTSEEKQLYEHITYMASIGYGYNKSAVQFMARDFAVSLGKNLKKDQEHLSNNWFYGFMKRWPDLKLAKPQKLSMYRAKSASKEKIDNYFKELSTIMAQNNLFEKPEKLYNIDETGISTEHSPPKIVCGKETQSAQAITSARSSTTTIIAAGNAIGNNIPPYYIFAGKRWNDAFLDGAPAGSDGEMSESGWSNGKIFETYITKHFARHVGITESNDPQPVLILYDGHKSHISLTLTNWAQKRNVLLFVLPPHTSHITQPLDVAVFGPLKSIYNKECQTYLKQNPGINISKYKIAELTAKPYIKALCPENLISAFRKTGIYPFNNNVITPSQIAPSLIYANEDMQDANDNIETIDDINIPEESLVADTPAALDPETTQSPNYTNTQEILNNCTSQDRQEVHYNNSSVFFAKRTINHVVKKPKRKFVPPYLSGSLAKQSNIEILEASSAKKSKQQNKTMQPKSVKKSKTVEKSNANTSKQLHSFIAKPGTSGTNKKGGPINLVSASEDTEDSEFDTEDDIPCCVCNKWQPDQLKKSDFITLTKWAKCDKCDHWTHLIYCTTVRVVRRDSEFLCPHCQ